jgi:hypothetical protein
MFKTYFQLGLEHILDLQGADHMAFIVVLCAIFLLRDWKRIILLATAFTIGHSLTLALAAMQIIPVNSVLIELLIPITIMLTAMYNAYKPLRSEMIQWDYLLAAGFGLIHGMGFSNFFRAMFTENTDMLLPLLYFNLGVETGQIIIILCLLMISFITVEKFGVKRRDWTLFLCGLGFGMALHIMLSA